MQMTLLDEDKKRSRNVPLFQKILRKAKYSPFPVVIFYKIIYRLVSQMSHIETPVVTKIGSGLYIGHAYCITINPNAILGRNCNIHKGVTIGRENCGKRNGTPVIGNEVWIGVNATIVGIR